MKKLGEGSNSVVWLARGPAGRVAVKQARHDHARLRILGEAQLLARLHVPTLPRLVEVSPHGAWMALEYIEGRPATDWAAGRSIVEILRLLARVADGVAALHHDGVVHGDIKPTNVLVDADGRPRIIDLGVAALPESAGSGGFRGTLGYAAPEQLQGERPGRASDLYALGAMAYELAVGHLPFQSAEPAGLAWLPFSNLPEPPASLRVDLPAGLDGLILWLLARRPADRPVDAHHVARELRAVAASPILGRPVVGMRRERRQLRSLVVEASEGRPVIAVVTGPPGSGRWAVITEALTTATREGLRAVVGANHIMLRPEQLTTLLQQQVPAVMALRGDNPAVATLAEALLVEGNPGMLLVHADHPLPDLEPIGARHLALPPLDLDETRRLLQSHGHDPAEAEELHRAGRGLPGAILGLARGTVPTPALSRRTSALLWATREQPVSVAELARRLECTENAVLDEADDLLDRGLLVESDDGSALAWPHRQGRPIHVTSS